MKTIREWLEELPEPYRTKALRNTGEVYLDEIPPYINLHMVLSCAFRWVESPEGDNYWRTFFNELRRS